MTASSSKTKPGSAPPSKHHYVRINSESGMRVYATNLALRHVAPLLIQDSVTEAVSKSGKAKSLTAKFRAGGGKQFTVRVDPERRETHVQMSTES